MAAMFKVTAPLFYATAAPHFGHAYSLVLADATARWHAVRTGNAAALVLTGTDEHGTKVLRAANAAGEAPELMTRRVAAQYAALARSLGVGSGSGCELQSVRTTDSAHVNSVQALWRRLVASRDIYLGSHAGWYSAADEAYVPARDVDFERGCVRGSPSRHVAWHEGPAYMLSVSRYASALRGWILQGDAVRPTSRATELLELLADAPDVCVSRPAAQCPWGVPVPGDTAHTVYVWFDALTAYLKGRSGTNGRLLVSPTADAASFHESVSVPDTHVLGKDIARFHGIMWPAMLMAAALPLPRRLLIHGHWTLGGKRIAKTGGADVTAEHEPAALVATYGMDSVRYYMLREGRADADNDLCPSDIGRVHNAELVNLAGNLFARAFAPALSPIRSDSDSRSANGQCKLQGDAAHASPALDVAVTCMRDTAAFYDDGAFHAGIERMSHVLRTANAAFSALAPWTEPRNVPAAQALAAQALACWAVMMQPVLPEAAPRLLDALGVPPADWAYVPGAVPSLDLSVLRNPRPWGSQLFARAL